MQKAIQFLIQFEQQLRVFHWQTKSYARHKAYGETYEALGGLIDAFVESYSGSYGTVSVEPIMIKNMESEEQIEGLLNSFITGMNLFDNFFSSNPDLLNLKDEIITTATKLKYLITLK